MANKEHLEILKQGVEVWNKWRKDNPDVKPDFNGADLSGANLSGADLNSAGLTGANLSGADLSKTVLVDANLIRARLFGTNLSGANLMVANIDRANFSSANLTDADLTVVVFNDTELNRTNFNHAQLGVTIFRNVDLSQALNLESVKHWAPSSIGIDTLYKSGGEIPVEFLRGCGIPEDFITFIPSHFGIQEAIQFYSCFISYSTKDEGFARRLYSRMRDEKLRVWFAPEDMKGGKLLQEQIEQAIQLHDRLLVVLSDESMASEWVKREIRNARRAEVREKRRKLFPIKLVDYKAIEEWKGFDGDGGEDLAFELGKYYIPDFSNWKDHDAFEKEFEKLLRDLRAEEK